MRLLPSLAIALSLAAAADPGARAATVASPHEALVRATLGPETHRIRGRTIEHDAFRFVLEEGDVRLGEPVEGTARLASFSGRGRFRLVPATESERSHLARIRREPGLTALEDAFVEATFLLSESDLRALVEGSETVPSASGRVADGAAADALGVARKKLGVDLALRMTQRLLNASDDGTALFAAVFDGERLPLALAAIDPLGAEGLLTSPGSQWGPEESALLAAGNEGPEFWYLAHPREEIAGGAASACRPKPLADALHYAIEIRALERSKIEGSTMIRFRPSLTGVRALPFDLHPSLRITAVERIAGPEGTSEGGLDYVQGTAEEGGRAAFLFERALGVDEVTVRVDYAGDGVLEDRGDGNFAVEARTAWYPNLGAFRDRATYDLVYRVPAGNQVVSVGVPVAETKAADLWTSTWRVPIPLTVAGFNYGRFESVRNSDEETGMSLEVFTNPGVPDVIREINELLRQSATLSPSDSVAIAGTDSIYSPGDLPGVRNVGSVDTGSLARSALADATNASRVFHARFGPPPYGRIAITQQSQWSFGQSWPSLIFLPYLAFLPSTTRQELGVRGSGVEFEALAFHEVAHQWWGNAAGWESYRDQWLSEGFAEFSAALVIHEMRGWEAYDAYLEGLRVQALGRARGEDGPRNAAGPISMGRRLVSTGGPGAYSGVVYAKGALVLHMLRMMMRESDPKNPDARFFAMLSDFLAEWSGRNPSTADFRRTVEKHIVPELDATRDGKLAWFFDQWVHGTSVPAYDVNVEIEKVEGNRYRLRGSVRQRGVPDGFLALVPIYVDFGKKGTARIARAAFRGEMTHPVDATVELPERPRRVFVNAHHEVLAAE